MINWYIYKSAFADFMRLKRLIVWFLVAFGLFLVSRVYVGLNPSERAADVYPMLSSLLVFRVLPLASAIFSTAVVSQEVEQKTIVYLLTRPVPRWNLILMRTLASMTAVAIVGALAALAVSFAAGGGISNKYFYRDLVAIAVGAAAYGSLFVLVSLLVNRAMIVCLLFAFAWETSVPSMPGSVHFLSITSYLNSIARRPSGGMLEDQDALGMISSILGKNEMATSTAWPAMIILIAFCSVAAMMWFSKFEYTPREDAE